MAKLNYNERSWAIDLISEINKWSSQRNVLINRAGGETTLKQDKETYFPDVLLFGDDSSGLILQGWELKMPDVPITDTDFLNNAKRKADIMGLRSFVLWNVTTAVLYKINDDENCEIVHTWNDLGKIKKRSEVEEKKQEWIKALHIILDDLTLYFNNGSINPSQIVNSISGNGIADIILNHTKLLADNLEKQAQSNGDFSDEVTIWWDTAKSEFLDYKKPWEPLARIILLSWINKLTFAHVIKKYNKVANSIDTITRESNISDAIEILDKIGRESRFDNIFKSQLGEEYLPSIAWDILKQINILLSNTRVDKMSNSSMQTIISNVVKRSVRRIYGQFTTPYELAAFINALVVTDKTKNMIDTCCGTGTIASACYDWKVRSAISEQEALSTVYASDKLTFPLQLASIALTSPGNVEQIVNVFNNDVVDLKIGMDLSLYSTKESKFIKKKLPMMGYVVSNLPFVQQEDLKKLNPKIKSYVNSKISNILDESVEINSRADLYAYIPFKQWELLEDGGKLAVIISNSWLATEWGNQFYDLLNRFYHVEYVIASNKGRWFLNADVVTNVLVLKKRSLNDIKANNYNKDEITKYVLLNETIYDLASKDNKVDFDELNNIAAHIRKNISDTRFTISTYTQSEIKSLLELGLSKNSLFGNVNWVLGIKDTLVKTSSIFDIARGERRGWDLMFYPASNHGIEREYIKPVLKTARDIKGYIAEAESEAFCCVDSIETLKSKGSVGALKWIKNFENEVNGVGKPLKEVLQRPNIEWYTMKPDTMAEICISVNPGDRLFFARLKESGFVNQRLMRFIRKSNKIDLQLASALLNSIIGLFYIESLGFGRGLGALDLTPTNLKNNSYILDPKKLSEKDKNKIIEKFSKLENRDALPIKEELDREDRVEFDNVVLNAFGINVKRDDIKKSLLELYNIRMAVKK